MNTSARILGVAVLAILGADAAWAQAAPTSSIFTCVDRNGRRITSDRPIPECLDREQRELSPSGSTRRLVGPALTENERTAQEALRRKEAEARVREIEERRRERVLTTRYPDKAAHDIDRAAAIQLIDEVTATSEKRSRELKEQRKAFDLEMQFYQRDPNKAPMALRRRVAENEEGIAEQQRFIAQQELEKQRVHKRFDTELAQLQKLWDSQRALVATPAASYAEDRAPTIDSKK